MPIRDALRAAVVDSVKQRDRDAAGAYRNALSAIDNAGAVATTGGGVQGTTGVGSSEAPRRELTEAQMIGIVRAEAESARSTAAELSAHPDVANRLRRQGDLLDALLVLTDARRDSS